MWWMECIRQMSPPFIEGEVGLSSCFFLQRGAEVLSYLFLDEERDREANI